MAVETSKRHHAHSTTPTVLIADDEPAMLSLVSRHARNLGLHVIEATDGDDAWEQAQKHHPDLVILDVMMPGMSGWEVCKRIKAPAFPPTGVIMLTGIGENLNEMTSPLFAADTWLNKPFDFAELDGRIRDVLASVGKAFPSPDTSDESLARKVVANKAEASAANEERAAVKKSAAKKTAVKKSAAKKTTAKKTAAKASR